MSEYTVTIGTANAPQGHGDEIPNTPRQRANALTAAVITHRIDSLGLQESGPILDRWYRQIVGVGTWLAPWNSKGAGGRTTGNGLLWRKGAVDVLHVRPLRFWWRPARNLPSTVRRRLSFVEALVCHTATDSLFAHINGHVPTAHDASEATRRRIVRGLVREGKRLNRLGLPVVVTMDCNGADLTPLEDAGFRVAARRGVDVVLVIGHTQIGHAIYLPAAAWSDHGFLVACPVTFDCTDAANADRRVRLPRRSRWFRR